MRRILLEAAEEDLDLAGGRVFVKGVPDVGKTFRRDSPSFANGMPGFYHARRRFGVGLEETSYFTAAALDLRQRMPRCRVVEVDTETGGVEHPALHHGA